MRLSLRVRAPIRVVGLTPLCIVMAPVAQLATLPVLRTTFLRGICSIVNLVVLIRVVRLFYNLVGILFLSSCGGGGLGTGLLVARSVLYIHAGWMLITPECIILLVCGPLFPLSWC